MLSYIIGARVPDIEGNFFALEHKDTALPCRNCNGFGSPDEGLSKGRGGIPFLLPPQNLNAMLKNSSGDDVALALEIWKDIEGYEGLYQISTNGRVKSLKREVLVRPGYTRHHRARILSVKNSRGWYLSLRLAKGGVYSTKRVHRLVAEAFVPNPLDLPEVNHKDLDKQNNHFWNLEWVTRNENQSHAIRNVPGMLKGMHRYNAKRRRPVIQKSLEGDFIAKYGQAKEASLKTGVCARNILQVAGKTEYRPGLTRRQAGGFVWEFETIQK